jgi:DNA segregation ATPase FtsK/SpoIIIE and related proteins
MINRFKYGKKIKVWEKNLYLIYFMSLCSTIFISVFLLINFSLLMGLIRDVNNGFEVIRRTENLIRLAVSVLLGILSFSGVIFVLYKFKYDMLMRLKHRQNITKMLLENSWYDSKKKGDKERIKLPKVYYRMRNGLVALNVEIVMGRYQKDLLSLEDKLEVGLYSELKEKNIKEGFVEYIFLYDIISDRLKIDEVTIETGKLTLMKSVVWEFDSLPHMLISGGTGGGKSYFILTLVKYLCQLTSKLYILDPKNADLADLEVILPNVYYRKEDISKAVNKFYDDMMERSETMKKIEGYKTGENYAYIGLEPQFLIFDEYVAYMDMLGRESAQIMDKLKGIAMLGRQLGFFIILACQRPDARYLADGMRDQFNFRVALGKNSDLGYTMMFGDIVKTFFNKPIRGRGYVDVGTNVVSEFYTPLVPKGYHFLEEIKPKEVIEVEKQEDVEKGIELN